MMISTNFGVEMKIKSIHLFLLTIVFVFGFYGGLHFLSDSPKDVNIVHSAELAAEDYPTSYNYDDLSVYEISWLSCCKVRINRSAGTGFVYNEDDDNIWVMTAGHIVNSYGNQIGEKVFLYFYYKDDENFRSSPPITGEIVWMVDNSKGDPLRVDIYEDLAIIKVPKKNLSIYPLPLVAKFDSVKNKISEKQSVLTTGCEAAAKPTTLRGYVKSSSRDKFSILPATSKGRSGSAVFNVKTKKIIGIVLRKEGVVNVNKIYRIAKWQE